jgi:hypothetical protein
MAKHQRQGGAMPGAGAFAVLSDLLRSHAVAFNAETTSQRKDRDSRAAALRSALQLGPANAAELAHRSGIAPKRIGGILSNDLATGRVLTQRDPRAGNRTVIYALAPRREGARHESR